MRTIGVVSTCRADYGVYLPLLRRIDADEELLLHLVVTGMHLAPEFGLTARAIEADGFTIGDRVDMLLSSDSPEGISKSMGIGTAGFAQLFARFRPDILVVLGDRFEMHAAALAALPFKIPVAHIHGGEITLGAIDDSLRHSMTKLSHIHFVATDEYARRVVQLGEAPWRVTVCGALSLDNLEEVRLLSRNEFADKFGIELEDEFLLVTYHPVTLEYDRTDRQIAELLAALDECGRSVLFTKANSDTGGRLINRRISEFVDAHRSCRVVDSLGTEGYFTAMAMATAMVGNSSSGIVESGSFGLPVVNIGTRQHGRMRGPNIIDTGYARRDVLAGIQKACDPTFRASLQDMSNPYDSGGSAATIVDALKAINLDDELIVKRFHDMS